MDSTVAGPAQCPCFVAVLGRAWSHWVADVVVAAALAVAVAATAVAEV